MQLTTYSKLTATELIQQTVRAATEFNKFQIAFCIESAIMRTDKKIPTSINDNGREIDKNYIC